MRILFMGTPEFAEVSLRALAKEFEIAAVISQPDKPKGRGMELLPTPVKQAALELGLPVFQPTTLRTPEALELVSSFKPDAIAVVAYGKLLPPEILAVPRFGCVNLHGSLLPKYRGAAPVQWAVINGEKTVGVTTMYLAEGMDTGDMIYTESFEVGKNETASELRRRIAPDGAALLCKTLHDIEKCIAPRTSQNESEATYAPMLKKEMGLLDTSKTAVELHNLIRGLSPAPGVFFFVGGKRVKIIKSSLCECENAEAGSVALKNGELLLYCSAGAVCLETVLPEGRAQMSGAAFYNGKKFQRIDG